MAGMRPDEAERFYEEDEDPAKVFAVFDAAKRAGRLRRTTPPGPRPELVPLRELRAELARELRGNGTNSSSVSAWPCGWSAPRGR
jgi:hypothetical protein